MALVSTKSGLNESQFEFTANVVRRTAASFLHIHFGERCETYEHNCECCQRWAALDRMLTSVEMNESLEQEIQTLETALEWRKELLARMKSSESAALPIRSDK